MKFSLCTLLVFAATSLVLSGCRSFGPFYDDPDYSKGTNDPVEIRNRWGVLADVVGKSLVPHPSASRHTQMRKFSWYVPGHILREDQAGYLVLYQHNGPGNIAVYSQFIPEKLEARGKVMPDGSVVFSGDEYPDFVPASGTASLAVRFADGLLVEMVEDQAAFANQAKRNAESRAATAAADAAWEREQRIERQADINRQRNEIIAGIISGGLSPSAMESSRLTQPALGMAQGAAEASRTRTDERIKQAAAIQSKAHRNNAAEQAQRNTRNQGPEAVVQKSVAATARARAEQQRQQEERQARRVQQQEAEKRAREQRIEAEKQSREQEVASYLARLHSSIRLAAKSCGKGDVRVGGTIPGGRKPLELVKVHYSAYCPGQVRVTGYINQYIGDGMSCVGSDMRPIDLPCKPEEARLVVDQVSRSD